MTSPSATRPAPTTVAAFGLVGLGAAVGTTVRWAAGLAAPVADGPLQPQLLVTLAINLLGSFLLGMLVGRLTLLADTGRMSAGRAARLRLLLGTGVLGGFTTYSAFALEAVTTARGGSATFALLGLVYAALSVAAGVTLAWAGLRAGRRGDRTPDVGGDDGEGTATAREET